MRVFTTTEIAAEIFGTTTQTIRNWIADGSLKTAPRLGTRREVMRIYVASLAERAGMSVEEINKVIDGTEARLSAINKSGATSGVRLVASASSP
jgi:DNA-binding transcriptional MerR regulator